MASINPYLNFNGNCEEAFKFYQSVFGNDIAFMQRFKEVPSEYPMPEGAGEKIMHVSLPIGQGTMLMGSDRPEGMGKATIGDNFAISINAESEAEADKLFNGISAGGNVTMPMAKAFWGAYFGMCTDKFGIGWMVNCELNQK